MQFSNNPGLVDRIRNLASTPSSTSLLWLIVLVALALRVGVTVGLVNDYFPDELYQYREQAHRLVYGYGFIPWEYEWGARNWALPGAIAAVLWVLEIAGLGQPEIYAPVLSALAIAASLTLVFSARRLAMSLAGPTAGILAAGAVAVSFPCITSAAKLTPEVLGAYALMAALALAVDGSTRRLAWSGILAGVVIGLRFQYAPVVLVLGLFVLGQRPRIAATLTWVSGLLATLLGFGMVDFFTWGRRSRPLSARSGSIWAGSRGPSAPARFIFISARSVSPARSMPVSPCSTSSAPGCLWPARSRLSAPTWPSTTRSRAISSPRTAC